MASSKKPRHAELPARLATFLRQTVRPGQRLLLGFSGGLDSCVLLHLLVGLRAEHDYELAALHVNHGLSPNADDWQRFCSETCASYQVPFAATKIDVPRADGLGIEAAARKARYHALLTQSADLVVLAHHRDDQAETLLLQLLRGAGVRGLAAMGGRQSVQRGRSASHALAVDAGGEARPTDILRPLLDIPRTTLEAYARAHGLRWVEDESNLDLTYDRNFLRHHIFPELERRFPSSRTTLARSAAHLAEAAALLDEVAREDAARWITQGRLEIAGLRAMSEPRAKNLLRGWLSIYLPELPSAQRLQEIYRQLLEACAEAMIEVVCEGGVVRRYRGEAWFEHARPTAQPIALEWKGEDELTFLGWGLSFMRVIGDGISVARLAGEPLIIRTRQGGERLRLHHDGPSRSLKNLFQEAGVPAWQRLLYPLVFWRDELVALPGIGVASTWRAGSGEDGLVVISHNSGLS